MKGQKKWKLFSPSDSEFLYATRVPFEESSVWSEVCVREPDFQRHPLARNATAYEALLDEGDVLYVPRHWWHHVESQTDSISVNLWCEHDLDAVERVKEALARLLMASVVQSSADVDTNDGRPLINPTDACEDFATNLQILNGTLANTETNNNNNDNNNNDLDIKQLCDVLLSQSTLQHIANQILLLKK